MTSANIFDEALDQVYKTTTTERQSFPVEPATPEPPATLAAPQEVPDEKSEVNSPPEDEDELIELVKDYWADQADELDEERTPEWAVKQFAEQFPIPAERIRELVAEYKPTVNTSTTASVNNAPDTKDYPPELTPLIASGQAFYDDGNSESGRPPRWCLRLCEGCRKFITTDNCCGKVKHYGACIGQQLSAAAEFALGLKPLPEPVKPKTAEQIAESWAETSWWNYFRGVDELQGDGTVKMLIDNFLPEGVTILTGLPKEGKSSVAMAIAKAATRSVSENFGFCC